MCDSGVRILRGERHGRPDPFGPLVGLRLVSPAIAIGSSSARSPTCGSTWTFRIMRSRSGGPAVLTKEENELLCRVEGDAAMGQIMRRHWIPACMSEEIAEPDGTPVRVRLL